MGPWSVGWWRTWFAPAAPAARALAAVVAWALLVSSRALAATPSLAVNEVLYDASGRDADHEFLEIYNPADAPVSLAGVVLESWRGSRGWVKAWTGAAGQEVGPHGFFLLGGAEVSPAPDDRLDEELANAAGAARLTVPGTPPDVVGWGSVVGEGLFTGAPAPSVPGGHSLARLPDGSMTGSNAADFIESALPTPGATNGVPGPVIASPIVFCEPPIAWPGRLAALQVRVGVLGHDAATGGGAILVRVAPVVSGAGEESLRVELPAVIAPADTVTAAAAWRPAAPGVYAVTATFLERRGGRDSAGAVVRAGPGPLAITEVMASPEQGAPEWIEIRSRGPAPVDLGTFDLRDPHGETVLLPSRTLEGGERVVLCPDADTLRARFPGVDSRAVLPLGPSFPSLPVSSTGTHAIALVDSAGLLSDRAPYDLVRASSGHSLERVDEDGAPDAPATWHASVDPSGGTPGRANSLTAASAVSGLALRVEGTLARSAPESPAIVRVDLGPRPRDIVVTLYSLGGRRVREILRARGVGGSLSVPLAVRDRHGAALPPGLYALVLDAEDVPSGRLERRALTVAVRER